MKATAEIELELLLDSIGGIAEALRRAADEVERCTPVHKGLGIYLIDRSGKDIGCVALMAGARDMPYKDAA